MRASALYAYEPYPALPAPLPPAGVGMSSEGWQPFLDKSILGAGLAQGAILSHAGDTLVASRGFKVGGDAARRLLAAVLGDRAALADVVKTGFEVSGVRYALMRTELEEETDVRYLLGRCKMVGAPTRGIIIAPTLRAIVFAVHDPLLSPEVSFGRANVAVTKLAESLMAQDY